MRGADSTAAGTRREATGQRFSRGFTLIEVLAALIIVALGMLGVIEAVSETARNGSYLRDKTVAHWIAMNQLTKARLAPQAPKIDKSSDEVDMAERRWRWTMVVTQTPVESVRRIDISVRLLEAPENSSLASISGFYGTAIAPAGTTIVTWQVGVNEQLPGGANGGKQGDGKKDETPPPHNPQPVPETDPTPDPTDSQ